MTVVQSCPILCDPWTVARQASPTMELSGEHMLLGSCLITTVIWSNEH